MDIIKAFTNNTTEYKINISGTFEEPLFRASDIANILDLKSFHASIIDFDETEKILEKIETPGGKQDINFLTEKGLYKLLFRSRKPIANQFQNWVCDVIKEIRIHGKYELEKQLEEKNKQLELKDKENQSLKEEKEILMNSKEGTPLIYIYSTDARPEIKNPPLKIGSSEKLRGRIKPYNQTHPWGKIIYSINVNDTNISLKTIENWIHTLLKPFLIDKEMFNIGAEEAKYHIINTIHHIDLICNNNNEERQLKLKKLVESNTMIIKDLPNPKISTSNASTQTEDFEQQKIDKETEEKKNKSIFDKYITECCELNETFEVSDKIIQGHFRIWSGLNKKEIFHALLGYLKMKFLPIRLTKQDEENVVMGLRGVRIKEIEYKQKGFSDPEIFTFSATTFSPDAKILRSRLIDNYLKWKKRNDKIVNKPKDIKELEHFLNNCDYVLKSNVWTDHGNGSGYYGLNLKGESNYAKKVSSTAKKVKKRHIETHEVIDSWSTIVKAAEAEGISATKMSRSIKNKVKFKDYYYSVDD